MCNTCARHTRRLSSAHTPNNITTQQHHHHTTTHPQYPTNTNTSQHPQPPISSIDHFTSSIHSNISLPSQNYSKTPKKTHSTFQKISFYPQIPKNSLKTPQIPSKKSIQTPKKPQIPSKKPPKPPKTFKITKTPKKTPLLYIFTFPPFKFHKSTTPNPDPNISTPQPQHQHTQNPALRTPK